MGFTDRNPNTQFAPEGRGSSDLETKVALLELKHTMAKSNLVKGEVDQFMYPSLGGGELSRSFKDADRGVFSKLSRQVEIYQSPCTVVVRK